MNNKYFEQAFVDTQDASLIKIEKLSKAAEKDNNAISPLQNKTLAVKDLFDVQGIPTAAGNPDWLRTHESIASNTNSCVQTLIDNGAIYKGKTLTDELAYSLNGQNIHYPALCNPITPNRLPGGSSSGSAVAVAAQCVDIGLGTDTGGSIRVPSSYNGLYGLRTSHGRIASDHMVPLAPSFDTVGWMCRNIEDLEKIAAVLFEASTTDLQMPDSVNVLVAENLMLCSEQADQIKKLVDDITLNQPFNVHLATLDTSTHAISDTFRTLQGYEIWQQHGEWIARCKPKFANDIQQRFDWCKSITQNAYQEAKQQQQLFSKYIEQIFTKHDVILLPTTPGRAPLLDTPASELNDYRNNLMTFTAIAGLCGLPQIHIPAFTIDKAPCGVSLIAPKNQDLRLISIAKTLMKQIL